MARRDRKERCERVIAKKRRTQGRRIRFLLRLLHWPVLTLGPGRRIGIWFQGCSIGCTGCIAPENRPFDSSFETPMEFVEQYIRDLLDREAEVCGVTISGGEPFDQPEALQSLVEMLHELDLDDILVYSGYMKERLLLDHPTTVRAIAALVDGPFVQGDVTEVVWKGSENQSLTVFNSKYAETYSAWSMGTKGRLQMARNERGVHLIGIPRQQDVSPLIARVRGALGWSRER